jgi:hypothetical protein
LNRPVDETQQEGYIDQRIFYLYHHFTHGGMNRLEFKPTDLILKSRAKHGVSKPARSCLRSSFETRASKSAVADFDTNRCRSRAGRTSVRAPQDEVDR